MAVCHAGKFCAPRLQGARCQDVDGVVPSTAATESEMGGAAVIFETTKIPPCFLPPLPKKQRYAVRNVPCRPSIPAGFPWGGMPPAIETAFAHEQSFDPRMFNEEILRPVMTYAPRPRLRPSDHEGELSLCGAFPRTERFRLHRQQLCLDPASHRTGPRILRQCSRSGACRSYGSMEHHVRRRRHGEQIPSLPAFDGKEDKGRTAETSTLQKHSQKISVIRQVPERVRTCAIPQNFVSMLCLDAEAHRTSAYIPY